MSHPKPTANARFQAPFGPLWVSASPEGLIRIDIGGHSAPLAPPPAEAEAHGAHIVLQAALDELNTYFRSNSEPFRFTVPVDWEALGLTPFQRRVLEETYQIPWGCVVTYGALARAVGNPAAARAVGRALAMNPVPIVIPCHRVVAASGALQGFSAGMDVKAFLLRHEGTLI